MVDTPDTQAVVQQPPSAQVVVAPATSPVVDTQPVVDQPTQTKPIVQSTPPTAPLTGKVTLPGSLENTSNKSEVIVEPQAAVILKTADQKPVVPAPPVVVVPPVVTVEYPVHQVSAPPPASLGPVAQITLPPKAAVVQTTRSAVTQEELIIPELLDEYKKYLLTKNASPLAFQKAAKILANVVTRIVKTPAPSVLTIVWDFFVSNNDGILNELTALQGIDVLEPQVRFLTEIVYTLFRRASQGVDVGNNNKFNPDVIRARLKSPDIIIFLSEKAKVVASVAATASK